ncbi:MAG TPA: hypothetical protein VEY92_11370 [Pseudoxanthomonas sp.]|nr:hypothetical protein [Pseudoxanthomonas sp.]
MELALAAAQGYTLQRIDAPSASDSVPAAMVVLLARLRAMTRQRTAEGTDA